MSERSLEYGPLVPEEEPAVNELLAQSFAAPLEDIPRWLDRAGRDQVRVVRRADGPVASCLLVPMGQWLGGKPVGMVGIAGVGTRPDARGQGVARRLMDGVVRELRAANVPLSTLYPAIDALYRRSGYERAGSNWKMRVQLDHLPTERVEGMSIEPLGPEDEPLAESAYREWAALRPGTLARGPYIWTRVRQGRNLSVAAYLVRGPTGVEGVVRVGLVRGAPNLHYELRLTDLVALTPAASRAIWRFLAGYRSLGEAVVWSGCPNDPLATVLGEQRIEVKLDLQWMTRIVDLPRAFAERGYPPSLRGELHFDVADDLLPENAGRWVLAVEAGEAHIVAGGRGEVRLDVRALAALYTGFAPPEWLVAEGRLDAPPPARELAGLLFGGPPPWMPDFF